MDLEWRPGIGGSTGLVRVVSLTTWEPPEDRVPAAALGFTQSAGGTRGIRGYVFWHRVELASPKFVVGLDNLLAVAIAHEIGHMLLPDGSHAARGLMSAPWDTGHFRAAAAGQLTFSPESAALIRQGLCR